MEVGRDPECWLRLADSGTSRVHAAIEARGDRWVLQDAESSNGTFVNGRRTRRRKLRSGDLVRFGPTEEFRFISGEPLPRVQELLLSLVRLALVARDPQSKPRRVLIGPGTVIAGRNPKSDLVLPFTEVSDYHARLETRGGRAWIRDHGSQNGTYVNGDKVAERKLNPGDEVAFAGRAFDVGLAAFPTIRGIMVLALLVAGLAWGTWGPSLGGGDGAPVWTRAMYLDQARESVSEAVSDLDAGEASRELVRSRFEIAIRSLIEADRLRPDRQTDREVAQALNDLANEMGGDFEGRDVFRAYRSVRRRGERRVVERISPEDLVAFELNRILSEFGVDTRERPIPPSLLAMVERFVKFWTVRRRNDTIAAMARSEQHMAMIRGKLKEYYLPDVFAYLPFIESEYVIDAISPAGALGMWQFTKGSARDFDLIVTNEVDQRKDPELATDAACRYIRHRLTIYGPSAFMCAVASYNKGFGGLNRCLEKNADFRSKWRFWDLVEKEVPCLRKETVEYVPRFLAAAIVLRQAEFFGLTPDKGGAKDARAGESG